MKNKKSILVSVCMITYNHEKFISMAIEGVLMQKCNFQIELIIGEDCSTDKTRQICQQYGSKYSEINLLPSETNLGMMPNFIRCLNVCTGKYITLCEGDDYWTDPNKLQKQVEFLEANKDFAICFHNSRAYYENEKSFIYEQPGIKEDKNFTIIDFIEKNYIATSSVIFHRKFIDPIPEWFNKSPYGDYTLYLLLFIRSNLKAKYLIDNMSVYRIHDTGIHGNLFLSDKGNVQIYKRNIKFWKIIKRKLLNNHYNNELRETLAYNYSLLTYYLIINKQYFEAIKYNTAFLFKLKFTFIKKNIRIYKNILRGFLLI